MSWAYITYEQGKKIEAICSEHYTAPGYRDADCPTCPIRKTCRMDLPTGETAADAARRTKLFETSLLEAAEKALGGQGQ